MKKEEKDLIEACRKFWLARKHRKERHFSGQTAAKMELYDCMGELWGDIKGGYITWKVLKNKIVLDPDKIAHLLSLKDRGEHVENVIVAVNKNYDQLEIQTLFGSKHFRSCDDFSPSGDGTKPDFDDIEIIDWGQTLRFGKYEVCKDAIIDKFSKKRKNKK